MPTRHQDHNAHDDMVPLMTLAEDAKSILLELGAILNQRYRNRGPAHETQQVLRRKNETVSRLERFITQQQQQQAHGRYVKFDLETYKNQQKVIERLQQELHDQDTAFARERLRWQLSATVTSEAATGLDSSLKRVLPHLRGLLEAYDREQGQSVDVTQAGNEIGSNRRSNEVWQQCLDEREKELDEERAELDEERAVFDEERAVFDEERAQLLEQVSDAADISQTSLIEREAALTCPISLDLFEDPVLATCCGKTFSSEALAQALRQNFQCPVCRAYRLATCANRDMASLVELHRTERSVLGLPDDTTTSFTTVITEGLW